MATQPNPLVNPQQGPSPSPVPMPQPQGNPMQGVVGPMMQQSQAALASPMGQPVPGANPIEGLAQHPLVQGILKALASAAQSYGWTAMQPSERLERTQLQQQKAETLGKLAETGAYEGANIDIRGGQLGVNQQKANTAQAGEESQAGYRDFQAKNAADRTQILASKNDWQKDMAEGRLGVAQQKIDQTASLFEQKLALATKQYGLDAAKVELMGEGMQIKEGMLNLAQTALAQKGTQEGVQTITKLQQLQLEHPILTQFLGLDDISKMVGQASQAPIPGVPQPGAGVQPSPSPGATSAGAQGMPNKAMAKQKQKGKAGGVGDPLGLFQ